MLLGLDFFPLCRLGSILTPFSPSFIHAQTQNRRRKALDYRYLSVMRALIWRYVCALQRRNEERPVNEDDIGEVKGDISSLRFELIDLFGQNGMDVSMCAKKSRGKNAGRAVGAAVWALR